MVAGLIGSDDYTEQMAMDRRPCGDDLDAEVAGRRRGARSGVDRRGAEGRRSAPGIKGGPDVAGGGEAVRPSPEEA